jgi:hypothetical protein
LSAEWTQYDLLFGEFATSDCPRDVERDRLTNIQFLFRSESLPAQFDLWIDDLSFILASGAEDCCPTPPTGCEGAIRFDDAALESRVRTTVGKGTGELYCSDVCAVHRMCARNLGVQSLGGLECLLHLRAVDLSDNQISDLAPLEGMVELDWLNLDNNPIVDVSPLVTQPRAAGWEYLSFVNTQISCEEQAQNLEILTANRRTGVHSCFEP